MMLQWLRYVTACIHTHTRLRPIQGRPAIPYLAHHENTHSHILTPNPSLWEKRSTFTLLSHYELRSDACWMEQKSPSYI